MDDELQPDPATAWLRLAQAGDTAAFGRLVRPCLDASARVAAAATGDRLDAETALRGALTALWRGIRAVGDPGSVPAELADLVTLAVASALRRSGRSTGRGRGAAGGADFAGADDPSAGGGTPGAAAAGDGGRGDEGVLDSALERLRPRDRALLARWVERDPTPAALAVAASLGVEDLAGAPAAEAVGTIVNLDGPLAGWGPDRLTAALLERGRAAVAVDLDGIVAAATAGVRPAGRRAARLRRVLPPVPTLLGTAAAAFTFVVGVGLLSVATFGAPGAAGPRPSGAVTLPTNPIASVAVDGRPADGTGGPDDLGVFAPFPEQAAGLPVLRVTDALALGAAMPRGAAAAGATTTADLGPGVSGNGRGGGAATTAGAGAGTPIAVAGWWTGLGFMGPCAAPASSDDPLADGASFCGRTARLSLEPPGASGGPGDAATGVLPAAHLHVQALPGLSLEGLAAARRTAVGAAVPVVVIGHFGDPRAIPCNGGARDCDMEFVIDRLAWVDRIWVAIPVAVRDSAAGALPQQEPRSVDLAVDRAYPQPTLVFSITGVPIGDISAIEPAVLAGRPTRGGFMDMPPYVWLVRIALPTGGPGDSSRPGSPDPANTSAAGLMLGWVVVNDRDAAIIASSIAP